MFILVGGGGQGVLLGDERPGTQSNGSQTTTDGSGGKPLNKAELDIGTIKRTGNETFSVRVTARFYGDEDLRFEEVMFCAYDEEGNRIAEREFGTVYSPESGEFYREQVFNVTTESGEYPTDLTVDHSRFRGDSRVETELLVWDPDRDIYAPRFRSLSEIQNDFTFPRSNETGECG